MASSRSILLDRAINGTQVEPTIFYRRGDTLPGIVAELVDDQGNPIDLTNYVPMMSARRIEGTGPKGWSVPRAVFSPNPTEGLLFYDVEPGDTDTTPGIFELVVTLDGATDIAVPTLRENIVQIRDRHRATNTVLSWVDNEDTLALADNDGNVLVIGDTFPTRPIYPLFL